MNRLIIFLLRKKLGVKLFEPFRFSTQKNKENVYYFVRTRLIKKYPSGMTKLAHVQLNWLLDDQCMIEKVS